MRQGLEISLQKEVKLALNIQDLDGIITVVLRCSCDAAPILSDNLNFRKSRLNEGVWCLDRLPQLIQGSPSTGIREVRPQETATPSNHVASGTPAAREK